MRIFDAHCHIYPDAIARKAVAAVDRFYNGLPTDHYNGTVATLVDTGRGAGISRFLVHSVATRPEQVESINRFIASAVGDLPDLLVGMGTMHLDTRNLRWDFENLVGLGLKGVKLHPDIQRFNLDDPRAMEIYAMCEEAGLPVCVHTGDHRFDYSNPPRVANVLRAFPQLKFIGAHFGGWSVWDEAARVLTGFPNILVDTSSTIYAVKPDKLKSLIRTWGAKRIMFGTDYPLWPQQPDIDALLALELTDSEYRRIFWDNAAALFGVE